MSPSLVLSTFPYHVVVRLDDGSSPLVVGVGLVGEELGPTGVVRHGHGGEEADGEAAIRVPLSS